MLPWQPPQPQPNHRRRMKTNGLIQPRVDSPSFSNNNNNVNHHVKDTGHKFIPGITTSSSADQLKDTANQNMLPSSTSSDHIKDTGYPLHHGGLGQMNPELGRRRDVISPHRDFSDGRDRGSITTPSPLAYNTSFSSSIPYQDSSQDSLLSPMSFRNDCSPMSITSPESQFCDIETNRKTTETHNYTQNPNPFGYPPDTQNNDALDTQIPLTEEYLQCSDVNLQQTMTDESPSPSVKDIAKIFQGIAFKDSVQQGFQNTGMTYRDLDLSPPKTEAPLPPRNTPPLAVKSGA